jgi:acyl carrier protein
MTMQPQDAIRQFITSLLEMKGERTDVSDTESLVTAGLLDSLDVMQTVTFLEEEFGVDFTVRPFNPDDFDKIESIRRLVT